MASRSLFKSVARDRAALAIVAAVVLAVLWLVFGRGSSRPARLTISAGRPQGSRHSMAESLAAEAVRYRVVLKLVETAGSEQALDRVNSRSIDLALVQGGLGVGDRPNVRQVAALHVEPLHLLVKKELAEGVGRSLEALRGKSVNLGEVGSGTHALASDVMRFAGMGADADFHASTLSYDELEHIRDRNALPDALFMVSLLPSRVAKKLVGRHGLRLVALPFGEAYSIDGGTDETAGEATSGVARDHVIEATIPAFTYGVRPAVPPEPVRTLGTRLLLVAHKDVDPEAVSRVLEATFRTPFSQLAHPPLTDTLLESAPEMPLHGGTLLYQERSKPLITGDIIDAIEKELSIAGAVLTAAFFLWQWLRSRYRRLRESGFEHYILKVGEIESRSLALELVARLDLRELLELQSELGRIKSEAIAKFADGELEGEDLMTGFLAHASDARDHLTRLILHERDNLEGQARDENREAAALWMETVGPPASPDEAGPDGAC